MYSSTFDAAKIIRQFKYRLPHRWGSLILVKWIGILCSAGLESGRVNQHQEPGLGFALPRMPHYAVNHTISSRLSQAGFPGIRAAHGKVFEHIGAGRRVQEMAERAQVTKKSMAELVQHLEQYRYVERAPDPSDRRAKIVRLTPRGQEAVAAAEAILEGIYEEWRRVLGAGRFDELQRLLAEIAAGAPEPLGEN